MKTAIAAKDSKDKIKAEIVSWIKSEMPKAPLFQQRDVVTSTLKALSRGSYAWDEFSAGRQSTFIAFQERFEAVMDLEQLMAEKASIDFRTECFEKFGDEGTDSSSLPWLEGTDKQVNWAFVLRSDWFSALGTVEAVDAAKDEIMENRSAQYWIKKLK